MLSHLIERAIEDGKQVFDFLKGDETYKFRLGATARPLYRVTATVGAADDRQRRLHLAAQLPAAATRQRRRRRHERLHPGTRSRHGRDAASRSSSSPGAATSPLQTWSKSFPVSVSCTSRPARRRSRCRSATSPASSASSPRARSHGSTRSGEAFDILHSHYWLSGWAGVLLKEKLGSARWPTRFTPGPDQGPRPASPTRHRREHPHSHRGRGHRSIRLRCRVDAVRVR